MNTSKSAVKPSKKIDMGAASNFGRDEIGINSPTHRNTHAEGDLFGGANFSTSTTSNQKTDLLDDIFKTCPTSSPTTVIETVKTTKTEHNDDDDVDDFFNPREEEAQEFGDFASAFGNTSQTSQSDKIADNNSTTNNSNVNIINSNSDGKKNEFADFGTAFNTTQSISNNTNNAENLLFAVNSTPSNAQTITSSSNQNVGDLLSDLDGISLDVSVPTGELIIILHFFFCFSSSLFIFFFFFFA